MDLPIWLAKELIFKLIFHEESTLTCYNFYIIEVGKITDLPQVKGNLNHAQIIMYENQTHRSGENH